MADVVNRTTVEYLRSVNTPDYPTADWLINPDLSALAAVEQKYWKVVGETVVEMTQPEKDAVDAAEAAAVLLDDALVVQQGEFETVSNEYETVLSLAPTNAFRAGDYDIHWSASVKRQSNRGLIKLRLLVDSMDKYELDPIDPKKWIIQTGPDIRVSWTQAAHTVELQTASTVVKRAVMTKHGRIIARRKTNG